MYIIMRTSTSTDLMKLTFLLLTLLHSERSKLHRVLAVLSAIGLSYKICFACENSTYQD